MKMNDPLRKAGHLFLALLLITMALPAKGEETSQSAATAQPSQEVAKPAQNQDADNAAPEKSATKTAPDQSKSKNSQEQAAPKSVPAQPTPAPINTPPESTTPPRGLKLVGNHWTPYQPPDPESFPEGAQIHIIVNGDTLWGMAGTHFQNPYLWPQIWNENRYILDSHWIYPGDPLLLPPRPTVVSEIVPASGQTGSPAMPSPGPQETAPEPNGSGTETEEVAPQASAASDLQDEGPSPAADYSDLYCTGSVRPDYQKTELYIANSEDVKIGLTTGDLVYLNGGRDGGKVKPGDSFLVIAKGSEVFHPVTGKWVGTYVRRLGKIKVLAVQDQTSIAEITESCQDRIEVGFEVEADRTLTSPIARQVAFNKLDVEPSGKPNGYIVHLQDGMNDALAGSMVDVDLGSSDGVHAGDVMLIYLSNTPPRQRDVTYDYKWNERRYQSQQLRDDDKNLLFPRKPIGLLMVISTSERTSSAKIINATRDVEVGNLVELK